MKSIFRCVARRLQSGQMLLLTVALVWPYFAAAEPGMQIDPQNLQSGSLLLRMKTGYATATRLDTDVHMRISGLVARVSVRQEFRNDGAQWVEGVYVFPLPDSAAVDGLRMYIGERFIEGEIREKEQAKKKYERAKAEGKKASLVRQHRANLFMSSVANIAPGETVSVEIDYLDVVDFDDGSFSLRFPMTLTPRYIPGTVETGRKGSGWSPDTNLVDDASLITPPVVTQSDSHTANIVAEVDAGVLLSYIASRYHPIDVTEDGGRYRVNLAGSDVPMDHDFELVWRPVSHAAPRAMLFSEFADERNHLLFMMIPPSDESVPSLQTAREVVLVIDTSGSMHGTSIEQAKKALALALDGLRPTDRFSVIQFNSVTHAFLPIGVPATPANISAAREYVRKLEANGGTEMRPALMQALHTDAPPGFLKQVIFVTDGSVGNEDALFRLIDNGLGDTRLFTVGIGSAPNGWFMRKAAELGRGTYTYVSSLHEVKEKMERLFHKLENPQVTDIELTWPSGVAVQGFPTTVPDLYAGEPIVVKVRLENKSRPSDVISVRGMSAMGGWSADLPLATHQFNAGVAAVWARAKIEDLDDQARRDPGNEQYQKQATATALGYHLVSKYTSLVAVDKTPVRPASSPLGKEHVASLLPYGQNNAAIFGFPASATAATLHQLIGAASVLLALILIYFRRRSRVSLASA